MTKIYFIRTMTSYLRSKVQRSKLVLRIRFVLDLLCLSLIMKKNVVNNDGQRGSLGGDPSLIRKTRTSLTWQQVPSAHPQSDGISEHLC